MANGLHSEMAMYARQTLKIPKGKLKSSQYYKPSGNVPTAQIVNSISMLELKRFYGLSEDETKKELPSEALSNGNGESSSHTYKPSLSHNGIIETLKKKGAENAGQEGVVGHAGDRNNAGKEGNAGDRYAVRKRKDKVDDKDSMMMTLNNKVKTSSGGKQPDRTAKPSTKNPPPVAVSAVNKKKETFFQKLKRVSNQPALATPNATKLVDVGEVATLKKREGSLQGHNVPSKLQSKAD